MSWIQTYKGGKFNFENLESNEIDIEDIAHALSMLCRYNGHVKRFYSVAEHSIHVSNVVSNEAKLYGLLHDATEAYISDIPRPFKLYFEELKKYEQVVEKIVLRKLDINLDLIDINIINEVKEADTKMLITERKAILEPAKDKRVWARWEDIKPYDNVKIKCYLPEEAEKLFLQRYNLYSKIQK
jgi:5'-deoxynucleotidase YfbR-like HD superfamily hydrolase